MRLIVVVLIIIAFGSCTKKQESSVVDTTKSIKRLNDTTTPSESYRPDKLSSETDRETHDAEDDRGYRWNVKTLQDKDADWLWVLGMPLQHRGTISELIHWPRPDEVNSATASRYQSPGTYDYHDESNVWCVEGKIKEYIPEKDGDIHLILTDGKNDLVAEVPKVDTMDSRGDRMWLRLQCDAVHQWLQYWLGDPSRSRQIIDKETVFVIGIPFFDKRDHGSGHAGNGIEIHPVLGISYQDEN
jgi:hypothetical protein